jgi:hypothetical protein
VLIQQQTTGAAFYTQPPPTFANSALVRLGHGDEATPALRECLSGTVAITTPVSSNEQLDDQVGQNDPLLPYNWPAINGATAARVFSIA